ncbi:MAG: hypothetical protein HRU18_06565 [Pseudoalteromonas sp.]|uniref:hypothetical protein n=1 Tax=Pseudoalteromonas sp. TaxID=53249 RepID=UPI001DF58AAC|nr:hypothetical protein [Pseudoalteromonas sp.]NRA77852.1 hypothetical protein [Pseudoalteromonas sp.]
MLNTYTIAQRNDLGEFSPVAGIPTNMTRDQAFTLANKARDNGLDVVAYNLGAE